MGLLDGYVALDLTDLKGQMCGKLLRDFGMEVIKLEPPGGDPVRRMGPFKDDEPNLETSLRFAYLNAGKRSLTLDIRQPDGRDLLLRLTEQVDVLVESFAPGELDGLGLGPKVLHQRNPRLLISSVTGFGQTGPHRDYLCPDIVGFAMGGLMAISGDQSLPPVKAPETQSYYFACAYAALGTLLALWQREKDKKGRSVDVSIQETIASQEHMIRTFAFDGVNIPRHGSQHEHAAPANVFPTSDGFAYVFVTRAHWRLFLDLWKDHPEELDGPEWLDNDFRHEKVDQLNHAVAQFTRQFPKQELARTMQEHGIPCLPVNNPTEFMADEQIDARQLFGDVTHPALGSYQQVSFPLLLDGEREKTSPPPLLGEHTLAILNGRLGISALDCQALRSREVI